MARARGRAADVVDELHRPPDELGQHRRVRLGGGVVVVLEVAALVGEQHDPGALLGELAHRRGAAAQRVVSRSPPVSGSSGELMSTRQSTTLPATSKSSSVLMPYFMAAVSAAAATGEPAACRGTCW